MITKLFKRVVLFFAGLVMTAYAKTALFLQEHCIRPTPETKTRQRDFAISVALGLTTGMSLVFLPRRIAFIFLVIVWIAIMTSAWWAFFRTRRTLRDVRALLQELEELKQNTISQQTTTTIQ